MILHKKGFGVSTVYIYLEMCSPIHEREAVPSVGLPVQRSCEALAPPLHTRKGFSAVCSRARFARPWAMPVFSFLGNVFIEI